MEQTKYTVFWNDGYVGTESSSEWNGLSLQALIDKGVHDFCGGVVAWAPRLVQFTEYGCDWERLRAESIAAGRVIELVDGKYIPRGVPEETKEKTPEGVTAPAKSPLQTLRDLVEIQGRDGTWNCDDYMLGMFNGMELALATMEGRDPQFRTLKPRPVAESTAKPALLSLTSSPDLTGEWKPFEFGSAHLTNR